MLLQRKNLADELLRKRNRKVKESDLIAQVMAILEDEKHNQAIHNRLGEGSSDNNDFVFDLLETDRIFHIEQIKSVCIDYRLRFLDSNKFRAQIPFEAVSKIKMLEKQHNAKLSGFKILAPTKLFHLDNYDDPLLFVPIGNDYYYLIHKWGNDINPYRRFMVRPLRDMGSLLLFLAIVSLLLSFLVSDDAFGRAHSSVVTLISFLFIFKALCGVALYYCFWKGKNFNSAIWNSNYYNH